METNKPTNSVVWRPAWPAAAALVVLAALLGGLALTAADGSPSVPGRRAFTWLRAADPPPGWRVARTNSGARLAYPASWHPIQTDRGTVSAAPAGPRGSFAGYLNATPRSAEETLANWRRFRPAHVAQEGAHNVLLEASGDGLRFHSGHGSCVVDSYSTSRARFREIACIIAGLQTTTVIVAAAPADTWATESPVLERAVSSFTT